MDRPTADEEPVTVATQTRISSAVPAVTTDPAVSAWTRADAHSTAVEGPGCTAASNVAAWLVHRHRKSHTAAAHMTLSFVQVCEKTLTKDQLGFRVFPSQQRLHDVQQWFLHQTPR